MSNDVSIAHVLLTWSRAWNVVFLSPWLENEIARVKDKANETTEAHTAPTRRDGCNDRFSPKVVLLFHL
jgi:hypothetical protein